HRREIDFKLPVQRVDAEAGDLGREGACVEARDIEQRCQYLFDCLERSIDVMHELGFLTAALALDQARNVEPRSIERLQDVVARCREKTCLGYVRVIGFGLGASELGIESLELPGALAHATLERGIGSFERLRRG